MSRKRHRSSKKSIRFTKNKSRTSKKSIPLTKKKSKTSLPIRVKQQKYPVRRYEAYHENFLTCEEIKDFLTKLHTNFPNVIQVTVIGQSAKGRPIYMATISEGETAANPKMAAMIVAGTNGSHWFTVSSALYIIENLVKGRNLVRIMDYFVIPCCNPDAYECSLEHKGKEIHATDLGTNFPFSLGVYDISDVSNDQFVKAIRVWKENYKFDCPERITLLKALLSRQVAVRLFITLEGNGTKITYPFGFCPNEVDDAEDLKKVARAGRNGIRHRPYEVGSMYCLNGMRFGTMVDYIRMCQGTIKFAYTIHVNKKEKHLDPCKIIEHGEDMMNCVRFMARNVYMMYTRSEINTCDDFFTFIFVYTKYWGYCE